MFSEAEAAAGELEMCMMPREASEDEQRVGTSLLLEKPALGKPGALLTAGWGRDRGRTGRAGRMGGNSLVRASSSSPLTA